MAEFAPSMERLRQVYVQSFVSGMPILARSTDAEKVIAGLAFDRALAAHDAEIRRDQAEKDARIAQRRIDVGYAGHPIITAEFPDNGQHIAAAIRAQFTPSPETETGD